MAKIDAKLTTQAANEGQRAHVRSVTSRLPQLSSHLQTQLNDADWSTKREIIRALVQRLRLGQQMSRLFSAYQQRQAANSGVNYGDIVPGVNSPLNAKPLKNRARHLLHWSQIDFERPDGRQ